MPAEPTQLKSILKKPSNGKTRKSRRVRIVDPYAENDENAFFMRECDLQRYRRYVGPRPPLSRSGPDSASTSRGGASRLPSADAQAGYDEPVVHRNERATGRRSMAGRYDPIPRPRAPRPGRSERGRRGDNHSDGEVQPPPRPPTPIPSRYGYVRTPSPRPSTRRASGSRAQPEAGPSTAPQIARPVPRRPVLRRSASDELCSIAMASMSLGTKTPPDTVHLQPPPSSSVKQDARLKPTTPPRTPTTSDRNRTEGSSSSTSTTPPPKKNDILPDIAASRTTARTQDKPTSTPTPSAAKATLDPGHVAPTPIALPTLPTAPRSPIVPPPLTAPLDFTDDIAMGDSNTVSQTHIPPQRSPVPVRGAGQMTSSDSFASFGNPQTMSNSAPMQPTVASHTVFSHTPGPSDAAVSTFAPASMPAFAPIPPVASSQGSTPAALPMRTLPFGSFMTHTSGMNNLSHSEQAANANSQEPSTSSASTLATQSSAFFPHRNYASVPQVQPQNAAPTDALPFSQIGSLYDAVRSIHWTPLPTEPPSPQSIPKPPPSLFDYALNTMRLEPKTKEATTKIVFNPKPASPGFQEVPPPTGSSSTFYKDLNVLNGGKKPAPNPIPTKVVPSPGSSWKPRGDKVNKGRDLGASTATTISPRSLKDVSNFQSALGTSQGRPYSSKRTQKAMTKAVLKSSRNAVDEHPYIKQIVGEFDLMRAQQGPDMFTPGLLDTSTTTQLTHSQAQPQIPPPLTFSERSARVTSIRSSTSDEYQASLSSFHLRFSQSQSQLVAESEVSHTGKVRRPVARTSTLADEKSVEDLLTADDTAWDGGYVPLRTRSSGSASCMESAFELDDEGYPILASPDCSAVNGDMFLSLGIMAGRAFSAITSFFA